MIPFLLLAVSALDVLDVDPAVGPYFEIRDAVAAASNDDVIRVAPGTYGYFGVLGKGLTVVSADPTGTVRVEAAVRVQNLSAGDTVVLSGLEIGAINGDFEPSLIMDSCAGSVRIQDCDVAGDEGLGVRINACSDVTFAHGSVQGGSGSFGFGSYGETAISATDSSLSLWDCQVDGLSSTAESADGGAGLYSVRCDLFLDGCTVSGGFGGEGDWSQFSGCQDPGSGGDGVLALDSTVMTRGCTLSGGAPGFPGGFSCGFGSARFGLGVNVLGSTTLTEYSGTGLTFEVPALALESTALPIAASGDAGDLVLLVVGVDTGRASLPGFVGDLHVGGPLGSARRALLGSSPVNTQLSIPNLPPLSIVDWTLQTVHLRPANEVVFGPVRSVTLLDSAW